MQDIFPQIIREQQCNEPCALLRGQENKRRKATKKCSRQLAETQKNAAIAK